MRKIDKIEGKQCVNTEMSANLYNDLAEYANVHELSMSATVRILLRVALKQETESNSEVRKTE